MVVTCESYDHDLHRAPRSYLAGGAGCAVCRFFSTRFSALADVSIRLQCDGVEATHSGGVNILAPVLNLFRSEFTRAHTVKYASAGVHFFSF
jgi:hypothetical protein